MPTELRELDRAVAELVMGLTLLPYDEVAFDGGTKYGGPLPHYSADTPEGWAAMRLVSERMATLGYEWSLDHDLGVDRFYARFERSQRSYYRAAAKSAPEAVARAALKALEVKNAE